MGGAVRGAGAAPTARTRVLRTAPVPADSLAAVTMRALISLSWVAYAGESGRRSSCPVSGWKATAATWSGSCGATAAAMSGQRSSTVPPAARSSASSCSLGSSARAWSSATSPRSWRPPFAASLTWANAASTSLRTARLVGASQSPSYRSVRARTCRRPSTRPPSLLEVRLPGAELGGQFLPPLMLVFVFGAGAEGEDLGGRAGRGSRTRASVRCLVLVGPGRGRWRTRRAGAGGC